MTESKPKRPDFKSLINTKIDEQHRVQEESKGASLKTEQKN